jgi:hypothetical protein
MTARRSCGVLALDSWLHRRAGQDEKRNVARVFVAVEDQRGFVGFYSLPLIFQFRCRTQSRQRSRRQTYAGGTQMGNAKV